MSVADLYQGNGKIQQSFPTGEEEREEEKKDVVCPDSKRQTPWTLVSLNSAYSPMPDPFK